MGTTTNYAFPYPEATGLVKDGWEDIKDLAVDVDTDLKTVSDGRGLVWINTTTFSAVSSQSLNNVFSSTYDNYRILINATGSADDNTNFRLRVGGVDNSTANSYIRQFVRAESTTVTGSTSTSNLSFIGDTYIAGSIFIIDIFSPFLTTRTKLISQNWRGTSAVIFLGSDHNQTVSYDGFSILPNSGTITGTITIYGYKK